VRQGEGHTRNISEMGAFVDAAVCPPVDSSVESKFFSVSAVVFPRQISIFESTSSPRLNPYK
jgi:hypothetical protein